MSADDDAFSLPAAPFEGGPEKVQLFRKKPVPRPLPGKQGDDHRVRRKVHHVVRLRAEEGRKKAQFPGDAALGEGDAEPAPPLEVHPEPFGFGGEFGPQEGSSGDRVPQIQHRVRSAGADELRKFFQPAGFEGRAVAGVAQVQIGNNEDFHALPSSPYRRRLLVTQSRGMKSKRVISSTLTFPSGVISKLDTAQFQA